MYRRHGELRGTASEAQLHQREADATVARPDAADWRFQRMERKLDELGSLVVDLGGKFDKLVAVLAQREPAQDLKAEVLHLKRALSRTNDRIQQSLEEADHQEKRKGQQILPELEGASPTKAARPKAEQLRQSPAPITTSLPETSSPPQHQRAARDKERRKERPQAAPAAATPLKAAREKALDELVTSKPGTPAHTKAVREKALQSPAVLQATASLPPQALQSPAVLQATASLPPQADHSRTSSPASPTSRHRPAAPPPTPSANRATTPGSSRATTPTAALGELTAATQTWDVAVFRAAREKAQCQGAPPSAVRFAAERLLSTAIERRCGWLLQAACWEARASGLGDHEVKAAEEALVERYTDVAAMGARFTGLDSIVAALREGDVALLRGSWLTSQLQLEGVSLPKRQDLPPEALWTAEELVPRLTDAPSYEEHQIGKRTPHDAKVVGLVAVSHSWETPSHPDPHGEHLKLLARVARQRLQFKRWEPVTDLAIFYDFLQAPRSPYHTLWFGHALVEKWLFTSEAYLRGGWPSMELALGELGAPLDKFLDLGKLRPQHGSWFATLGACKRPERPLPPTPAEFAARLACKSLNDEADRTLLECSYARTLEEMLGTAQMLDFSSRGWGAAEANRLAQHLLPHCDQLLELRFAYNALGDEGAASLAGALPRRLVVLGLSSCSIGDAGVAALTASMDQRCPRLETLQLSGNPCGDVAAEALARSLVTLRRLGRLVIDGTQITNLGQRRLLEAWQQAGRPAEQLQLLKPWA